jgi:hypothetical protein
LPAAPIVSIADLSAPGPGNPFGFIVYYTDVRIVSWDELGGTTAINAARPGYVACT